MEVSIRRLARLPPRVTWKRFWPEDETTGAAAVTRFSGKLLVSKRSAIRWYLLGNALCPNFGPMTREY